MSADWSDLFPLLTETPRENGTEGLATAAATITGQLDRIGVRWERQELAVRPFEPAALGVLVFLLCCACWWSLRRSRRGPAIAFSLLLAAVPVAQLDWQLPLTPGLTAREVNVFGVIPAPEASQRIILAAHYDTKTELTDHIVRLPIQIAGGILMLAAIAIAPFVTRPRLRRLGRIVGASLVVYGVVFAVVFSGGAFQPLRSPGALDDGAACAVLLKAAEVLSKDDSLRRTEVVFAFFAGEEVGAQGAWAFVEERLPSLPAKKTFVVNLDPVGASRELTVVHREGGVLRSFAPDESVVALLDAAHRRVAGRPIAHTRGGGLTDAFPFRARGIPAATVISAVPPFVLPRGMHTHRDAASRIDRGALDLVLELVVEVTRAFDRERERRPAESSAGAL